MDTAGRFAHVANALVGSATQACEPVSNSHGNHNYADISIHNANAVFGNVYNHYHSYESIAHSSNKRKHVDETEHSGSRIPKGPAGFSAEQLINSLKFEGMWQRHETIVGAAPGTCQWILSDFSCGTAIEAEEVDTTRASMLAFGEWLGSGEPYFWIRGSAGSGKSTLVQYIVRHTERIKVKLSPWSGDDDVVFASYFFWRAGTFLQKSTNGLLRSLLVQLLESSQYDRDTISSLLPSPSTRTWTQNDLFELLRGLISSSSLKVCLFVDALDEFHGYETQDQLDAHQAALQESIHSLLDILEDLWSLSNVKLCIASRPGNEFEMRFEKHATIDLELANHQDIDAYVRARLARRMPIEQVKLFRDHLIESSSGVFLWIKLAVDMLLDGYADEEDLHSLFKRLDSLPIGLESMYSQMLGKVTQSYADDCEYLLTLHHVLRVLLHAGHWNILPWPVCSDRMDAACNAQFYLLCWQAWQEGQHQTPSTMKRTRDLLHSERSVRRLLQSRCGGLLCVRSSPQSVWDCSTLEQSAGASERRRACRGFAGHLVDYVHRSAEEFLAKQKHMFARLNIKGNVSHLIEWPELLVSIGKGAKRSLELLDRQASADGLLLLDLIFGPADLSPEHELTCLLYNIAVKIHASLSNTDHKLNERFLKELGSMPLLMDELFMIQILELPWQILEASKPQRTSLAFSTFCAQALECTDYVLKKLSTAQPLRTYDSLMVINFYSVLIFTSDEVQDMAKAVLRMRPMLQRALNVCGRLQALITHLLQSILPTLENAQLMKRMCQHHHTFLHKISTLKSTNSTMLIDICGSLRLNALSQIYFSKPIHQWLDQLQVLHPSLRLDREAFLSGSVPIISRSPRPPSAIEEIRHPSSAPRGGTVFGLELPMSQMVSELTEAELNLLFLEDVDGAVSSNDKEMVCRSLSLTAFFLVRHGTKCSGSPSSVMFPQRLPSNLNGLPTWPFYGIEAPTFHLRTLCQPCRCKSCSVAHATESSSGGKSEGRQPQTDEDQDECFCPFARRTGTARCPSDCPGCPCVGAFYTWILRQCLQNDELDWENWFNTLIYAYGYTLSEFESWEAAIHSEEVELRRKWRHLQSKT